jgi:heterodisulfide reductase subunit A
MSITLTIDGQQVQAEEGQSILEVAREAGFSIPTLCYHPALEPYGACRLCVVEVTDERGRSNIVTSCTAPVEEDIAVSTDSPDVIEARRTVLALMLSRCPSVPVIQDLAAEYGIEEPPFEAEDPNEKCILCGLCVRVCHDVVGADVLNFADRGVSRGVGPAFMEKTRDCIGCGACTIVCPTGAIEILMEEDAVYQEKPLGPTSAVYVPSLQAVPRVPVIDTNACIRFRQDARTEGELTDACGVCQMLCEADAIDFDQQDELLDLEVGAILVATGFDDFDPRATPQYSFGKSPNIITGIEFERLSNAGGPTGGEILMANGEKPESVAFLHCVGSRDEHTNKYCSRVCCMYAMKQAHLVREKTEAEVFEFYMDIRAFGKGYEEFYERVQEDGVNFIRGKGSEVNVRDDGKLLVKAEDADLGRPVTVAVDMVVLGTGMTPQPDAAEVGHLFGIGCGNEGFFTEAHPKLRPVETNTEGVFLAGACQGPKDVPDTVAHANAAAAEALAMITKGEVTISPTTAVVDEDLCAGCKTCIQLCPYTAISFVETEPGHGRAEVNDALCKGCGTCAAACPAQAISARHFTTAQMVAQIEGLFQAEQEEEVGG